MLLPLKFIRNQLWVTQHAFSCTTLDRVNNVLVSTVQLFVKALHAISSLLCIRQLPWYFKIGLSLGSSLKWPNTAEKWLRVCCHFHKILLYSKVNIGDLTLPRMKISTITTIKERAVLCMIASWKIWGWKPCLPGMFQWITLSIKIKFLRPSSRTFLQQFHVLTERTAWTICFHFSNAHHHHYHHHLYNHHDHHR